jgi:diguanylate cyclase (GGDEF)-like protein
MATELDELREWYTQHLVARLDALLAAKEAFLAGDVTAADSIRRIAHTVKGSGATYGFPEVTAAAATVDHAPDELLLERLESLVEVIRTISGARSAADHPTILIVDDDESITKLVASVLAPEGYRILIAATGAVAEIYLEEEPISLVILDLFLPDGDGRNVLVRIRKRPRTSRIPVLVITSHDTLAVQKECLTLGADDFIEKPLEISKVVALIQRRLSGAREADREARRDLLTGLPNRAALHEAFHPMAAQARRLDLPLSIAILDLDLFKAVNDAFGHPAGDRVLQNFARTVRENLRAADVFGRWGGEEFVVLMPETDLAGARSALEKTLAAFRARAVDFQGTTLPPLTFSGGVVLASSHDTLDSAVAAADRLLYHAKDAGRARIFTASGDENADAR